MTDSKWDRTYRTSELRVAPSPFIADCLPVVRDLAASRPEATGLDIAGGTGRNALALVGAGVAMTVVDSSAVGLARAETWAVDRGLTLDTMQRDLEADGMPMGQWDVLIKTYFLDRSLLVAAPMALRPGGLLLFAQPTTTNLERHEHPSRRFLLEPGELEDLVAAMTVDVEIIECTEEWRSSPADPDFNPHEARLILRRR